MNIKPITAHSRAFTLIELSIVLVIIGLIVGGVLVGRDLIAAAAIRSQITQIEKFQTAANTFRGKYAYLPGDIPDADAVSFGFITRFNFTGATFGNGLLEGFSAYPPFANQINGFDSSAGENLLFWKDLSNARLIDDGPFASTYANSVPSALHPDTYVPFSKINSNGFVLTYSESGKNYFTIQSGMYIFGGIGVVDIFTGNYLPSLSVKQAYNMDKKLDDGMPGSGRVISAYDSTVGGLFIWADGTGTGLQGATIPTAAKSGSATTCFDNGGVAGAPGYSITQNNGVGMNCGISFTMQ